MDRWLGKVAVVSGASSGIGEAVAKSLVSHGMIVVGLARRESKLESIQQSLAGEKGKFHAYQCDVTDEKSVVEAFNWIKSTLGGVHVLVNNAGIVVPGGIAETDSSIFKMVFDVNVFGLLYCSQQAIRLMKEDGFEGTIININSVVGHKVPATMVKVNVYPASKHAVTAVTETLHNELREANLKIRVTSISPGIVETEIFASNGIPMDVNLVPHLKSEDVASTVTFVLSQPQRVQITELTIKPLGEAF